MVLPCGIVYGVVYNIAISVHAHFTSFLHLAAAFAAAASAASAAAAAAATFLWFYLSGCSTINLSVLLFCR
jgi:hypothetical protein